MPACALGYCYDGCGSLVEDFYFAAYLLLLLLLSCVVRVHSFSPPFILIFKAVSGSLLFVVHMNDT